ncbi:alpha/beta hydrolase family protein [Desnuesiella massiliensis]|uniref:alpha/beta hydrolase family protein n=1 Tax=Desnuesiella massiliensis TaxID=1650662 RepID=UPI0006E3C99B|nr:acetylxylan esterase [Desnuesiella massiliensis]
MGIIIFLTAMVAEVAFAVFCIITKSNQQKVRNIIRIAAFMCFALFTALSIIDWSFRYYTLAAFLFLLAIMGTVDLIKKKQEKRAYKIVRVAMKTIGMIVLILMVTLPSIIFPQHEIIKWTGQYQVTTIDYTYTDTKRIEPYTDTGENRKLNVKLWYPKNSNGTYPLIVFSHGAFGIKTSNETLYNELASHGYVVCSMDHTYQCLYTTDDKGHTTFVDKSFVKELASDNAESNKQQSYDNYQKWMRVRTDDINFVIDYILTQAKSNASDTVYKLVDTTKIGVMGHSLGGSAALGIGRMRNDISAVIALESPFMCDIKGIKNNEFIFTNEKYPIPVLNVYSDSSWDHLADWPQYAENYALLSNNNPTAFNVHISGVGHFTLTDLALTSPLLTRLFNGQKSTTSTEHCLKVINKICLEFFDCYLKGSGEFKSNGAH